MLSALNRMPLKSKLLSLFLLPILGTSVFLVDNAVSRRVDVVRGHQLQIAVDYGVKVGDLVHELQLERGSTALFIASGGSRRASEVQSQYARTDAAADEMEQFVVTSSDRLASDTLDAYDEVRVELALLDETRRRAAELPEDSDGIKAWYTDVNAALIHSLAVETREVPESGLTNELAAYLMLLEAKEYAGQERAFLAEIFTADEARPGEPYALGHLAGASDTLLVTFRDLVDPEIRAAYDEMQQDPIIAEVERYEIFALDPPGPEGYGVDPEVWFSTMTGRIDLLKELEDTASAELSDDAALVVSEASRAFWLTLATAAGLAVLSLGLGALAVFGISAQLRRLVVATTRVAEGDLDAEPLEVECGGEIGDLIKAFNAMSGRLQSLVADLSGSAIAVADQARTASVRGAEVSNNVSAVTAAVEQIDVAIREVSISAAQASQEASNAVLVARDSSDTVSKLDHSSEEIGSVLEVIASIAKQTNLLALNATIEAARAGEFGKGFAVVANEVGELANQTAAATKEIAGRIEAIRGDTAAAVAANIRIGDTINRINDISAAIASAVEEQSATTANISRSLEDATRGTEDIAATVAQLAQLASDNGRHVLGGTNR